MIFVLEGCGCESGVDMDTVNAGAFVMPLRVAVTVGGGGCSWVGAVSPRRGGEMVGRVGARRREVTRAYVRVGDGGAGGGDDGLRGFLRELSGHSLLCEREERGLLMKVQALREHERVQAELKAELGRDGEDEEVAERLGMGRGEFERERRECLEARDELVKRNLRLVVHIASLVYRGKGGETSGVGLGDLIQEGCLALIRAAERFDLSKAERFAPYAFRAVWSRCRRAYVPVACIVSIPQRLREAVRKTKRLDRQHGVQQRGAAVAEAEMHLYGGGISLDAPLNIADGDLSVLDVLQSTRPRPQQVVERGDVWAACRKRLSERDALIVKLRFGLDGETPRLAKHIAKIVGLSAARVGQIVAHALHTLRHTEPGLLHYLSDL